MIWFNVTNVIQIDGEVSADGLKGDDSGSGGGSGGSIWMHCYKIKGMKIIFIVPCMCLEQLSIVFLGVCSLLDTAYICSAYICSIIPGSCDSYSSSQCEL